MKLDVEKIDELTMIDLLTIMVLTFLSLPFAVVANYGEVFVFSAFTTHAMAVYFFTKKIKPGSHPSMSDYVEAALVFSLFAFLAIPLAIVSKVM